MHSENVGNFNICTVKTWVTLIYAVKTWVTLIYAQ